MISKFNVLRDYVVTYTTWGTRDDIKTYNVRAVNEINALMMFHNKRIALKSHITGVTQCPAKN